jgi:aerobic-type carbon monoxide dehydrogenase small subunit (CoxS/CutS family)
MQPSSSPSQTGTERTVELVVDGRAVAVPDDGSSLLTVLREQLGLHSPKDGCSPQGQCGCCTVLVDGQPRVACVTPVRRVRGRAVTTLDGLDADRRAAWGEAFCATGASQCGFCTPGIVLRLEALRTKGGDRATGAPADAGSSPGNHAAVEQALLAHLCRCTGWRTILDAWDRASDPDAPPAAGRDLDAASRRATIEGRTPQRVTPDVPLGSGGFADDTAPADALVAVWDGQGWAVGETLEEARAVAGKVQGRRTTVPVVPPLALPPGDWGVALRTSWVEPAYLETDASWCRPGDEPASPLANGGAFGGKVTSIARAVARQLADEHGRAVRVLLSREDTVRLGPKRPPLAAGIAADGTGIVRVARTPGIADTIRSVAPGLAVEEVDVAGPPTSADLRAAGWGEALILLAAAAQADRATGADGSGDGRGDAAITTPEGAWAHAEVVRGDEPRVAVEVRAGDPLDEVTLRSYCVGAAHMGLSWVSSEGLAVGEDGEVHDLTIRSFGVLRAVDTPPVDVTVVPGAGPPVNGSDAVFLAVAAATWLAHDLPADWPTGTPLRRR